jgi:hypothetical protein
LFLCFDQVERLQTAANDQAALRQFGTLATAMLAEPGPRVVATFIRPTTMVALEKALELADVRKLAQMWGQVPFLSWEQARRVVCARLSAEPTCRPERQKYPGDPTWPPGTPFLEKLYREYGKILTPRLLIQTCSREFERLQKAGSHGSGRMPDDPPSRSPAPRGSPLPSAVPREGTPPPLQPVRPEHFSRLWDELRTKHLAKLQGIQFDEVMAKGVSWLVSLTGAPYVCVQDQDKHLGDVNLRFQPTARRGRAVGISLCNQQPRVLWHRLDRVRTQWEKAKGRELGSLVILRSDTERTTEAAETRLTALRQAGAQVVLVDRQQLAELAAFQAMLAGALEGNLTRKNGLPIEAPEYESWAKDHLSEAVKELFHQVIDSAAQGTAPAAEPRPKAVARK